MVSLRQKAQGITHVKLLVTIALVAMVAFLLWMAVPRITIGPISDPKMRARLQAVNNAHSIHLATLETDSGLWPGDLKARGEINDLSDFVNLLVQRGALKPRDLGIFAGPGFKPYVGELGADGRLSPPFRDENCFYKIYLAWESEPANTIFLVSKNPIHGGFIVLRKGGDCSIYKSLQLIEGHFPGTTANNPANCLNPGPTATAL